VGYGQMPPAVREPLLAALLDEQRGLCAYTGIAIDAVGSHIEHLLPQSHCHAGEDLAYANMVACYPAPGTHAKFGAVRKGNWPSQAELTDFVSPRSAGCEQRFDFAISGAVRAAANTDRAAQETIRRLALDHAALRARRQVAIDATLQARGGGPASLSPQQARRRLADLETAEAGTGQLEPFCFVLKQALRKHIARLEAIRRARTP
jgi:uncharacterized protein (TIGR02646 family)